MTRDIHTALRELVVPDTDLQTAEQFEAMISNALQATEAAERVLAETVLAARHAGLSWSQIGALIGVSKQAAQQRFSTKTPQTDGYPQIAERKANAFNEIAVLKAGEADGLELIGVGAMRLTFRQSTTAWRHRRVVRPSGQLTPRDKKDGWQVAAVWFPFLYLKQLCTD